MLRSTLLAAAVSALSLGSAGAQETPTIDAAVDTLYAIISGPVGEARDFDALRELYLPDARMTVAGPGEDGEGRVVTLGVEDYIERNASYLAEVGFTETETRRQVHRYGELATVLSGYEGVRADTGEVVGTGVNMITLARVDGNWKVAAIAWRGETEDWPVDRAFEE